MGLVLAYHCSIYAANLLEFHFALMKISNLTCTSLIELEDSLLDYAPPGRPKHEQVGCAIQGQDGQGVDPWQCDQVCEALEASKGSDEHWGRPSLGPRGVSCIGDVTLVGRRSLNQGNGMGTLPEEMPKTAILQAAYMNHQR